MQEPSLLGCRARIVEAPEAYRWSSAAAHLLAQPGRSRALDLDFSRLVSGTAT